MKILNEKDEISLSKHNSEKKTLIKLRIKILVFALILVILFLALLIIILLIPRKKGVFQSEEELEIFKKYEKLDKIGEGAISKIYMGRDKETNELVAIKEVSLMPIIDMNITENTKKEIKFMSIFSNNTNSVKLYDKYEYNDNIFIVMELCDGDLSQFLKKSEKGFSYYEIKVIFKQLNNILYDIRSKDMVHNSLTLDNILIKFKNDKEFDVKLSDYGSAKLINKTNIEWGLEPFSNTTNNTQLIYIVEKIDLFTIGIDIYKLIFNESAQNISEYNNTIVKNITDNDIKDLMLKLIVENATERIEWKDYFNHSFFQINDINYDNITNIKKLK